MLLRCQLMAITLQMSIHHFQARKSNVRVHIAQPAALRSRILCRVGQAADKVHRACPQPSTTLS